MEFKFEEAENFFDELFYGKHHFPDKIKKFGPGWSINTYGDVATFDGDMMTRLVFMAHRDAIRVSIFQAGPNRLKIAIHKRKHGPGRFSERHPTIEEALKKFQEK